MNEKEIIVRFNKEVIAGDDYEAFQNLIAPDFVNHSAPEGKNGSKEMWHTLHEILHPALSNLQVLILEQFQDKDVVTTRKQIIGIHTGDLLGISPTRKKVVIDVIDIVRVQNGQYKEHWGLNTLTQTLVELKKTNENGLLKIIRR